LSVIGFDDIAAASWPAYDLTTIRQPVERMIDMLVSEITRADGTRDHNLILFPGRLVLRSSARLSEMRAAV
jgi:DNA-binding LacI/PurR family transcriptional regulator